MDTEVSIPRGMSVDNCRGLSNDELTRRLGEAAVIERKSLAFFLAFLIEFDRRRLYAESAHPSLFAYLTRKLGYAEEAAAKRIYAARAARKFPAVLAMLDTGELHLSAVVILASHLTAENHQRLLEGARGKSKRELEFVVAGLAPREIEADCVRRERPSAREFLLNPPPPPLPPPRVNPPARIEPLSPERVRFSFTASAESLRRLERAKELLRHKHPYGRLEDIIDELLEFFLKKKDPDRRLGGGIC